MLDCRGLPGVAIIICQKRAETAEVVEIGAQHDVTGRIEAAG